MPTINTLFHTNEIKLEFILDQIEISSPYNFEAVHSFMFPEDYGPNVANLRLVSQNPYVDFYYMDGSGVLIKYEPDVNIAAGAGDKIYVKLKVNPSVTSTSSLFESDVAFEGEGYVLKFTLKVNFTKLNKVSGAEIYVEYDSSKPYDPLKGDLIINRSSILPYWPQSYSSYIELFAPISVGEITTINYITGGFINSNNYPEFPRFIGSGDIGYRVKKNNIDLISGNKTSKMYIHVMDSSTVYEHILTIVDISDATPPSNSDPVRYYYDEKLKKVYITSKTNENNPKSYFGMDSFTERYGEQLVDYGNDQLYPVEDGNTINVGLTETLYVFYGNNKDMWGVLEKFKYNKYMHKPYKIYILIDRGTVNAAGKYSTKVKEMYVYTGPTLKDDNVGSFKVTNSLDLPSLVLKGSVRMTLDDPGLGKKTWDYAIVNINRKKANTNTWVPVTLLSPADNKIPLDFSSLDNIFSFLTAKVPLDSVGDRFNMSVSVGMEPGNSVDNIQSPLLVDNYNFSLGTVNTNEQGTSAFFNNENLFTQDLDCHPDLNNIDESRPNENVFPLEYSGYVINDKFDSNQPVSDTNKKYITNGLLIPSNLNKVLDRTEIPSDINSFIYHSTGMKNSRYEGSFVFSQNYNEFTNGDKNTFGKTPSIEIRRSYFAYYNAVHDLYPLVNGKMLFDIKYLIGPNGDISSPIMDGNTNINLLNTFSRDEISDEVNIYADTTDGKEFKDLNKKFKINELGLKPYPIFYSQNSANAGVDNIEFWGLKESLGGPSFNDYSFIATGDGTEVAPTLSYKPGSILQPIEVVSLDVDDNDIPVVDPYIPYTDGVITLPSDKDEKSLMGIGAGNPLSNNYKFIFEHTVATTYINDIKFQTITKKRQAFFWKKTVTENGTYEDVGYFELWALGKNRETSNTYTNVDNNINPDGTSVPSPVGLVDKIYNIKNHRVIMSVYYSSASSPLGYIVKSLDITDNFSTINSKFVTGYKEGQSILLKFNNNDIENLLKNKGYSVYTEEQGGTLKFITWTIKGEIDDSIVQGTEISLKVEGELQKMEPIANQNPQNYFFPTNTLVNPGGPATSRTIYKLVGDKKDESRSLKLDTSNPKYWDFAKSGSSVIYNTLFFKIKNGNDSWGKKMMQKDIKYVPSASSLFQGGVEPSFISFPKIQNSWEAEVGDQIRFNNDEDLTYNIVGVEGPKTQSNDTNELKIILDRDINPTTNLNIFLIRRWKKERGNMVIESKFPYSNPPREMNTQGFIFPEYLSAEINDNPDKILKDLSEKGIIN